MPPYSISVPQRSLHAPRLHAPSQYRTSHNLVYCSIIPDPTAGPPRATHTPSQYCTSQTAIPYATATYRIGLDLVPSYRMSVPRMA
eukprot:1171964-Rhodomonas_salina.2